MNRIFKSIAVLDLQRVERSTYVTLMLGSASSVCGAATTLGYVVSSSATPWQEATAPGDAARAGASPWLGVAGVTLLLIGVALIAATLWRFGGHHLSAKAQHNCNPRPARWPIWIAGGIAVAGLLIVLGSNWTWSGPPSAAALAGILAVAYIARFLRRGQYMK